MKRTILTIATTLLLSFMGLRAQECDTVSVFPWHADFGGGLGCWESTGNGSWTVSSAQTIICYLNSSVTTTGYMTITTPHLRLDCDSSGLRLWWKDKRNYMYPNLKVMVLGFAKIVGEPIGVKTVTSTYPTMTPHLQDTLILSDIS